LTTTPLSAKIKPQEAKVGKENDAEFIKLGSRIKEVRKALKLTQTELGKKANLSGATIRNYESGRSIPKIRLFDVLEKEYKVNKRWLYSGKGEMFDLEEKIIDRYKALKQAVGLISNYEIKEWDLGSPKILGQVIKVTECNPLWLLMGEVEMFEDNTIPEEDSNALTELTENIQADPVLRELFERLVKHPDVARLFLTQMQGFDPEKDKEGNAPGQ
jgi:transcriptional regulator with XRE-family HTH domain